MSKLTKVLAAMLVLVLLGGGTATAAKLITGKQIKNGSLTSVDVKKGSLGADRLSAAARKSLSSAAAAGAAGPVGPAGAAGAKGETGAQGVPGAQGTAGAQGAAGAKGDTGERGPSDVFIHRDDFHTFAAGVDQTAAATPALPAGTYAVTASSRLTPENINVNRTCVLRYLAAENADTTSFTAAANTQVSVALAGTVTIPAGVVGVFASVRVVCELQGDAGTARDTRIVATRVTNVTSSDG